MTETKRTIQRRCFMAVPNLSGCAGVLADSQSRFQAFLPLRNLLAVETAYLLGITCAAVLKVVNRHSQCGVVTVLSAARSQPLDKHLSAPGASPAGRAAGTVGIRPRSCHVLARHWCFSARRADLSCRFISRSNCATATIMFKMSVPVAVDVSTVSEPNDRITSPAPVASICCSNSPMCVTLRARRSSLVTTSLSPSRSKSIARSSSCRDATALTCSRKIRSQPYAYG